MDIKINREDVTPLYSQLKEQIKKEVITKNFPPGTKIMTEDEIIRRVIQLLQELYENSPLKVFLNVFRVKVLLLQIEKRIY